MKWTQGLEGSARLLERDIVGYQLDDIRGVPYTIQDVLGYKFSQRSPPLVQLVNFGSIRPKSGLSRGVTEKSFWGGLGFPHARVSRFVLRCGANCSAASARRPIHIAWIRDRAFGIMRRE